MRKTKKPSKTVIPFDVLQSYIKHCDLIVDVPSGTLCAASADLASAVGIAWLPDSDGSRESRRAYRHAIERACTRHLVPRSGKRGVAWRVKWSWIDADGNKIKGGAL